MLRRTSPMPSKSDRRLTGSSSSTDGYGGVCSGELAGTLAGVLGRFDDMVVVAAAVLLSALPFRCTRTVGGAWQTIGGGRGSRPFTTAAAADVNPRRCWTGGGPRPGRGEGFGGDASGLRH